ncbi:protein of unknown function [Methylotuvimicrobium alcaliphilum 20Z]|uniref:Uncharacterized protein n=1 Tax=Methylotuvimicrobium alcaliphilum (strain DSM 19304 / NCIMB 14124 / VKM B-2133 / 20Z) TaxID=1091494 RepID=G4STF6_META2|nr:protein of unknown function [Methylotuvimicrobium alcaliphilum 20Z]
MEEMLSRAHAAGLIKAIAFALKSVIKEKKWKRKDEFNACVCLMVSFVDNNNHNQELIHAG